MGIRGPKIPTPSGARLAGDDYQHLYTWFHALHLLRDADGVTRVEFEASAGDTYLIRLTGFNANEIEYTLRLTGPECDTGGAPGDVNGDGFVDFHDLLLLLAAWGPCEECPEDIDGDGFVDFDDLLLLLANWS